MAAVELRDVCLPRDYNFRGYRAVGDKNVPFDDTLYVTCTMYVLCKTQYILLAERSKDKIDRIHDLSPKEYIFFLLFFFLLRISLLFTFFHFHYGLLFVSR